MLISYHNINAITKLLQTKYNRMMMVDNNKATSPTISCQLSRYQLIMLDKIPEVSWWDDLSHGSLFRAYGGNLLHLPLPITIRGFI